MSEGNDKVRLQVLIAAFGKDGIEKISALSHPVHQAVEYIVSWQNYDMQRIPDEIRRRNDFTILPVDSIGSSENRNNALKHATSPFVLISDQDVSYEYADFDHILEAISKYPDYDYFTHRYRSSDFPKDYPEESFDLNNPPKGYYVSAIELVLNLHRLKTRHGRSNIAFNPHFGINGLTFCSGEEDVLLATFSKNRYKGRYLPVEAGTHNGSTTDIRLRNNPKFIQAKGAIIGYRNPFTWPLRMLTHALRSRNVKFLDYCRFWVRGVRIAREKKVFQQEAT